MNINISYDPSANAAPAGFFSAVNFVVQTFDAIFTNNVTLNLQLGWGQVAGQKIYPGAVAESWGASSTYSSSQVLGALTAMSAQGDSVPLNGLPVTDPTNGTVTLTTAEARAIGLAAPPTAIDGYVMLNATPGAYFSFQPTSQDGLYSAIGALEHEITEIMGRTAGPADHSADTALDLYRLNTNGLSLDHGNSVVALFNYDGGGDRGDWQQYSGGPRDPFQAFTDLGQNALMSPVDLKTMAALGWADTPAPALTHVFEAIATGQPDLLKIYLTFSTDISSITTTNIPLSNGGSAFFAERLGHTAIYYYETSGPITAVPTPTALQGVATGVDGLTTSLSLAGVSVQQYDHISMVGEGDFSNWTGAPSTMLIATTGGGITGLGVLNTVDFGGPAGAFGITQSGATVTVTTGTMGNGDGPAVSTLNNVQQLQFTDVTVVLDRHSQQDMTVYQLYQATYGRMPDNAGFRYWTTMADTFQPNPVQMASIFMAAPEFTQLYGASPTNQTFITELYQHVLGRAPDQAGLDFWVGQADAGQAHPQLLVDFAVSPENVQLIGAHVSSGYWTT